MKNKERGVIVLLMIMILFLPFSYFFFKSFFSTNIYLLIFLIISTFIVFLINGYEKDKNVYKTDIGQIVFIYSFIFLIFIYLSGLILGFTKSPYSLELYKILKNIMPILLVIIIEEVFKYIILKKNSNNKVIVTMLVILFVLLDIGLNIFAFDLTNPMDIFQFVSSVVIKSIIENILFVYIIIKSGYAPTILYRCIFSLYPYLVPIEPDLGLYVTGVFNIVVPTLLFLRINTLFSKHRLIINRNKKFISLLLTTPIVALLIVIMALVSNLFSYTAYAIGSNSMKNIISKGDAVVVKKINKDNIDDLKIDDIIAYSHDSKTIVHRIVNIRNINNQLIINTKGDNNQSVDNWNVTSSSLLGKVEIVVPFIGYPTVWLTEQLER